MRKHKSNQHISLLQLRERLLTIVYRGEETRKRSSPLVREARRRRSPGSQRPLEREGSDSYLVPCASSSRSSLSFCDFFWRASELATTNKTWSTSSRISRLADASCDCSACTLLFS